MVIGSTLRYEAVEYAANELLAERIVTLAHQRRRFGYRRIHAMLRREGVHANHKRVYRLYRDAQLAIKKRKRRKGVAVAREVLELPRRRNEVWSMDFVMDSLSNGRRIKILTIVDDCTKQAVDLVVDVSISGHYVTCILDRAARFRGYPSAIRTDQGPEFTGRALDQWAYDNQVKLKLTNPENQRQNAYIETTASSVMNVCTNMVSVCRTRRAIIRRGVRLQQYRPHSMLGYRTPPRRQNCTEELTIY